MQALGLVRISKNTKSTDPKSEGSLWMVLDGSNFRSTYLECNQDALIWKYVSDESASAKLWIQYICIFPNVYYLIIYLYIFKLDIIYFYIYNYIFISKYGTSVMSLLLTNYGYNIYRDR